MSADDVVKIIEVAARRKITDFRLGELQFSFQPREQVELAPRPAPEDPAIAQENLVANEIAVKDEQLAFLRLADPAAYEQMIAEEQLEDS